MVLHNQHAPALGYKRGEGPADPSAFGILPVSRHVFQVIVLSRSPAGKRRLVHSAGLGRVIETHANANEAAQA